jgi:hypothetical protein
MAQQTAVDIMFQRAISVLPLGAIDAKQSLKETYQQAKEMEKKQIESAWKRGDGEHDKVADKLAKQYYTQTYGTRLQNETN